MLKDLVPIFQKKILDHHYEDEVVNTVLENNVFHSENHMKLISSVGNIHWHFVSADDIYG
jgi:hypothetical protein